MSAKFGRGSVLKHGDGAGPEVFTAVAGITKVDGPKIAGKPVEITNHGSPGTTTEYLGTVADITWSFEINLDPTDAVHKAIRADSISQVLRNWTYTKPGESTTPGTFAAIVKNWSESEDPSAQRIAKFDLQASGTLQIAV